MELKNAVAVCLISLFSATLVVLIARSLDSQVASQLEPQLTSIAEELQAIRKQGGFASSPGALPREPEDRLVVYFLHGKTRCENCRALEATAKETLQTHFAAQLDRGELAWKVLNFEMPQGEELGRKFDVIASVVVLARMQNNQLTDDWTRLDKALGMATDKAALTQYLRDEIGQMLAKKTAAPPVPKPSEPAIPVPDTKTSEPAGSKEPPAIPIPE
jgi:hypothetical protein